MTGSLQLKNGTYYVVVNLYVDGKRKPKWVNTHLKENCGKRELDRKYREILAEYENAPKVEKSSVKFSDYIQIWLAECKIKVDEVTYQHYRADTNNHIYPYFKNLDIKLVDVDRQTLQTYFTEKHEHGRMDGKGGLSAKTLKHHKNIIHQTLELAVLNELIPFNPCNKLTLPKVERNTYNFYNLNETKEFLTAVKNEPLFTLYYVTAVYGLRRSEVLGLKWDSIDLENERLTIKHTRTRCDTIIEKDKTKTKSSLRSFPLSDEMVNLFVRLKNEEKANKKLFGSEYIKNDYIFKWQDGRPYSPDYITSRFSKDLKKHGLKHIAFHGLRHSCGSLLNEQGFTLKDIQEWLGHSDIQTTANIYLHLDTKRKEKICNTMSNALKI
ncbi:MAG: site-specific integrase [Eubacterium sp.]|nr:site-specific integrase [Eubacterium sp.]